MSIKNHITWDCVVKIMPATWLGTKMGQLRKVEGAEMVVCGMGCMYNKSGQHMAKESVGKL